MDDDKRRLRLYQERYLADGDLHSDGPGRARRFRWKNIGEFTDKKYILDTYKKNGGKNSVYQKVILAWELKASGIGFK